MKLKAKIMDEKSMSRAIARISYEIIEKNHGVDQLCLIGILTRGADLARLISEKMEEVEGKKVDVGYLDITPFRDDKKPSSSRSNSQISFNIEERKVILVDDVIYTGRTVRAAIDAVMALGRPKNIQLAVLIDRGHRELPIRPDYVGKNVPTSRNETVKVLFSAKDSVDEASIFELE